jgi:hypothetical protein
MSRNRHLKASANLKPKPKPKTPGCLLLNSQRLQRLAEMSAFEVHLNLKLNLALNLNLKPWLPFARLARFVRRVGSVGGQVRTASPIQSSSWRTPEDRFRVSGSGFRV